MGAHISGLEMHFRLDVRMPSSDMTQRKRSRSEIPKDSALKFPKVGEAAAEMRLPLTAPAPTRR